MKKLLALLTLVLLIALAVAGCAGTTTGTGTTTAVNPTGNGGSTGGTSTGGSGTLIVNATDAPPSQNVTSVIVTVASVKVHLAGAGEDTTVPASGNDTTPTMTSVNQTGSNGGTGAGGQWINIPLGSDNATFDLLQIQGILHSFGSANLTPGTYTQIRVEISSIKVGLNGNAPQEATLPSGVLKVVRPFQVASDMATSLTLDFQADRMVTVTGNNHIIVKPVVKLSITRPEKGQNGESGMPTNPGSSSNMTGGSANMTGGSSNITGQTMIPTTTPTGGGTNSENGTKPSDLPTPNNK